MKKKLIFLVGLSVLLTFGLIFTGCKGNDFLNFIEAIICDSEKSDGNGNDLAELEFDKIIFRNGNVKLSAKDGELF